MGGGCSSWTGTLALAGLSWGEWRLRSEKSLWTSITMASRFLEAVSHLEYWLWSPMFMAILLLLSTNGAITIFSLFSDWLICFFRLRSSEFSDSLARAISSLLESLAASVDEVHGDRTDAVE